MSKRYKAVECQYDKATKDERKSMILKYASDDAGSGDGGKLFVLF